MDRTEIIEALDDVFDQALVFHAFTDYMRDYELVFHVPTGHLRYTFRYCVEARVETTLDARIWATSLDDSLLDAPTPDTEVTGYVWGVRWQEVYPGARLVDDSEPAARWQAALGQRVPFHEAVIETNAHRLALVFSDLVVEPVAADYTPFRVGA